ncbi:Organ specific protein [Quillaja saponaria]|uniref:Organ specific protein n=1 Tax=Quillaja saponaria TaxID=32244 RepID=A0AAD7PND2_QUISA|nr:Organ specific protein [Quillaja saponaria]
MEARKDPGEYWRSVMKEQPMPEAIQGLIVYSNSMSTPSDQDGNYSNNQLVKAAKHKCDQSSVMAVNNTNLKKPIVEDFEPRPSATAYDGDNKGFRSKKVLVKDFEPRPSITAYDGDDNGARSKSKFFKDFEPRPSASAYDGGDNGDRSESNFVKDFEPRPSASAYDGGDNGDRSKSNFVKDFEPRPNK